MNFSLKTWQAVLPAVMLVGSAFGQSTIVYSGFVAGWMGGRDVDLDGDGNNELTFNGRFVATPSNPSFHNDTYSVSHFSQASVLTDGGSLVLVTPGTLIGPSSLSPVWSTTSIGWAALVISYVTPESPVPPQTSGPLADAGGLAFLPVRWQMNDGLHYGWVRLFSDSMVDPSVPNTIHFGPLVVDWAYELRANTPIQAGAVPEPSSVALLGLCGSILYALRWKRRCQSVAQSALRLPPVCLFFKRPNQVGGQTVRH